MTEFVDTNVLLYASDASAVGKQNDSIDLLERLSRGKSGVISTQVLVEFCANATRKYRMRGAEVEDAISSFRSWRIHRPDFSSIIGAIHLQQRYQLAWYDAMILSSAIEAGCGILWTEDFQDGQRFGSLVIRNPYKDSGIV